MNGADRVVDIRGESDIVLARRLVREAASALGFGVTDTTRIVTAASELARNIVKYAVEGTLVLRPVAQGQASGLELDFCDKGPGIADIQQAMAEGYSTAGGLGMGLPGARRLMDDFRIQSTVGQGTRVVITKWQRR